MITCIALCCIFPCSGKIHQTIRRQVVQRKALNTVQRVTKIMSPNILLVYCSTL